MHTLHTNAINLTSSSKRAAHPNTKQVRLYFKKDSEHYHPMNTDRKENSDDDGDDLQYEDDVDSNYEYEEESYNGDEIEYGDDADVTPVISKKGALHGIEYIGDVASIVSTPSKNMILSVYRQLASCCIVDVDPGFYSATLEIQSGAESIFAQISFPSPTSDSETFPEAPPVFMVHSHFNRPWEHLNIIYNCHPLLLKYRWNMCTDFSKFVEDIQNVARVAHVDGVSEPESCTRLLIELINMNSIDISGLYPNSEFGLLPFFSHVNADADKSKHHKTGPRSGTGYSSGYVEALASTQKTTEVMTSTIELLKKLETVLTELYTQTRVETALEEAGHKHSRSVPVDQSIVDAIFYTLDRLVTSTVTPIEFFDRMSFYVSVLSCTQWLPPPSEHIHFVQGLAYLHSQLYNSDGSKIGSSAINIDNDNDSGPAAKSGSALSQYLDDETDQEALALLHRVVTKLRPAIAVEETIAAARCALEVGESTICTASPKVTHVSGGSSSSGSSGSCNRSSSSSSSSSSNSSNSSNSSSCNTSSCCNAAMSVEASSGYPQRPDFDRVIYMENPFESHLFLEKAAHVQTLPSKWYRRIRIELCSLRESVPDNVLVFSGMEVSQPNLLRVIMYPESADTPYCGGAFEFDVFLPSTYPEESPSVLLRTTGGGSVRFNPNLYANGKVCLSLLGTWPGEKWDPASSSLAQVFNSILFLIFVEYPYFNEPGYQGQEGTPNGTRNSKNYNDVIRLGTLRYAYLEHVKSSVLSSPLSNQLSRWIVPMLVYFWRLKGKETAEVWAKEKGGEPNGIIITNLVSEIDKAINDALATI